MKKVFFSGRSLFVNGSPFIVRGGEIEYFRIPRAEWRRHLELALEGGLNTVTSYIPWYFHEYEEGRFDFTGESLPERDLRGFLLMLKELDLKFVARPGPFINSELRFGGLPEWLCAKHPEVLSRRADGDLARGRPSPAEGENAYRSFVRKWYGEAVPLISEFQITRGGPVIMFQPDNELSAAWSYGLLNSLYDPETIAARWPEWLKSKYGTVGEFCRKNPGTQFREFREIEPPRRFPSDEGGKRLAVDWLDFKRRLFSEWGVEMARWASELGIEVPFVFNEPVAGFYGHGDHSGFGRVIREKGIEAVTACHTYSDRILDLDGVQNLLIGAELLKSSGLEGPAISLEMNVLWNIPRLCRSDLNWSILTRYCVSRGLDGAVIYPYSEGIVDFKDAIDGPEYFAPGCVSIGGARGPAYGMLKDFFSFVGAWEKEISSSVLKPELAVAYTAGMRYLDFLGAPRLPRVSAESKKAAGAVPGGEKFDGEPKLDAGQGGAGHDWTDGYEGVTKQTVQPESGIWRKFKEAFVLASRLNFAAEARDLVNTLENPGRGVLVVPNTGSIEKQAMDYLVAHLEEGGTCVFSPAIPMFDLDGTPDNRLMRMLGAGEPELFRPAGGEMLDYGCRVIESSDAGKFGTNSWIFHYPAAGKSDVLATWRGKPVARRIRAGRGLAIVVGFDPVFTTVGTLRFWDSLFRKHCGVSPAVSVSGTYCGATLRRGEDFSLLTLANLEGRFGKSIVGVGGIPQFEIELHPLEARMLVLGTPCAGNRIVYTTSELVPVGNDRRKFKVSGHSGTAGEIAFAGPAKARISGGDWIATVRRDGLEILRYSHSAGLEIEIS